MNMKYFLFYALVFAVLTPGQPLESGGFFSNLFRKREGQRERPGFWYQVQAGDTLFSLSRAYKVSIRDLKKANRLEDDHLPIQRIWIPRSTYDPSNEELPHPHPRRAVKKPIPSRPSPKADPQPAPSDSPVETAPVVSQKASSPDFQWPVKNPVLYREGLFGAKPAETRNSGILIEVSENVPVHPARKGKTVFRGQLKGYGNTVILDHQDNYFTVYAHLGKISKLKEGTAIGLDQVLGYTGMSGKAHKPILHFEVRHLNEPLDPLRFLDPEKVSFSDEPELEPESSEDS